MRTARTATASDALAQAIRDVLISPNVYDSNLEPANLVDTTQRIASELHQIADAINNLAAAVRSPGRTPPRPHPGRQCPHAAFFS